MKKEETTKSRVEAVKNPKDKIISGLEGMKPGAMMQIIAQQYDGGAKSFLAKHIASILVNAVKNGKIKASALKDSIKDFGKKNVDDNSNIDWDNVKVDEDTFQIKCLLDGKIFKQLKDLSKTCDDDLGDVKKDIEETDKKLHDDVKKANIKIDDEKLNDNGLAVANVIDDKENEGKSGKELTKEVDAAIEAKDELKTLEKTSRENQKKLKKIKVDPKIDKMDDKEIENLEKKIDSKKKTNGPKTMVKRISKKIKSIVGDKYNKNVQVVVSSLDDVKNTIKENKLGKIDFSKLNSKNTIVFKIDFQVNDAKGILGEAKAKYETRIVDQNEKDKDILKIYKKFKKIIFDEIGKKSISTSIACLKHWNGKSSKKIDTFFMFVGLANAKKLNENLLNEDENPVSLDNMAAAMAIRAAKLAKSNSTITSENALESLTKWISKAATEMNYDSDMSEELKDKAETIFKAAQNSKDLASIAKKYTTDMAMKVAEKMISVDIEDMSSLDLTDYSYKGVKKLAEIAAKGAAGEVEELMSHVKVDGNNLRGFSFGQIFKKSAESLGIKDEDKILKLFSKFNNPASIRHSKQILDMKLSLFVTEYASNPDKAIKHLMAGRTSEQKDVLAEIATKMFPDAKDKFESAGIKINGAIDKLSDVSSQTSEIANSTKTAIAGTVTNDMANPDSIPLGVNGHVFSYTDVSRQIANLDDIFDDGKVDAGELKRLKGFAANMNKWSEWAMQNANSKDPNIQMKVALIRRAQSKYDDMLEDNNFHFQTAQVQNASERLGGQQNVKPMPENEEAKSGWKQALGLDKAFTAIGWARLAAKTTGIVLNHGTDLVDIFGQKKIKKDEDKNIIAELRCILTNGEGSKSKFEDTKFSIRFDANDCKWHATCLDNRKMQFPEDKLLKAIFDTQMGKKFKKTCYDRFSSIFKNGDKASILPYMMKNASTIGIKMSDDDKQTFELLSLVETNIDKILEQFK